MENSFEVITPDVAWAIGLIWSDGCLKGTSIDFVSCDKKLVCDFNKTLKGRGCIKRLLTKNKNPFWRWGASSITCSRRLRSLGLHESKSFTIDWPNELPKEFAGDFVRGVFDGDGTFGMTDNGQGQCSIATASEKFMKSFIQKLGQLGVEFRAYKVRSKKSFWQMSCVRKAELTKLFNLMYKNPECKRLERKRKKFLLWLSFKRKRPGRKSKHFAIWKNKKLPITEIAKITGVKADMIRARLAKGMSLDTAIATPSKKEPRNLCGWKSGKLTVQKIDVRCRHSRWMCICSCGVKKSVRQDHLLKKKIKSCGCSK